MTSIRSAVSYRARQLRSVLGGAAVILTYHRVAETDLDPHLLAIAPERFAEHVHEFAKRYQLVTVGDIVHALSERHRLPRKAVAISFDDGYSDALESAVPILRSEGATGTLFVATACLQTDREFWWDELEQLLLLGPLPEKLVLTGRDGRELGVDIPQSEREPIALPNAAGWNVTMPAETVRRDLYASLSEQLRSQPPRIRQGVLAGLREQTGTTPGIRASRRCLRPADIGTLANQGILEVGAHTADHVWLSSLSIDEQRDQITQSKEVLESFVGRPVSSFSYPYGSPDSFTSDTERLVQAAGFLGAVTTGPGDPAWGSVGLGSDPFALPRLATGDVPAGELIPLIDRRLGL